MIKTVISLRREPVLPGGRPRGPRSGAPDQVPVHAGTRRWSGEATRGAAPPSGRVVSRRIEYPLTSPSFCEERGLLGG